MASSGPLRLLNKNFILLWQGQLVSMIGSQMHYIAMMFWIKHATDSATLMGTISMLSMLPGVILGPIGGAVADRYSRKKIIVGSDLLCGLLVLSLALALVLIPDETSLLIVWIFIISVAIGIISAFFRPAISASIPDLVPAEKLAAANSMNQSSFQVSQFIGQSLGGVLFRLLGATRLFMIDGLSYLFSGLSESFIEIPQKKPANDKTTGNRFAGFKKDIIEGFKYVWRQKGLRHLLFAAAFLNFFLSPIIVLLPFFIEDYLHATTDWFGFIIAAFGIGALVGYALAGSLKVSGKKRSTLVIIFLFLDVSMFGVLGLMESTYSALIVNFFIGALNGMVNINIITILQATTASDIRGRVFGLLGTLAGGLMPIGMGLSGLVADLTGRNIPLIYISCGGISAVLTLMVSVSRDFREYLAYEPKEENNNTHEESVNG